MKKYYLTQAKITELKNHINSNYSLAERTKIIAIAENFDFGLDRREQDIISIICDRMETEIKNGDDILVEIVLKNVPTNRRRHFFWEYYRKNYLNDYNTVCDFISFNTPHLLYEMRVFFADNNFLNAPNLIEIFKNIDILDSYLPDAAILSEVAKIQTLIDNINETINNKNYDFVALYRLIQCELTAKLDINQIYNNLLK